MTLATTAHSIALLRLVRLADALGASAFGGPLSQPEQDVLRDAKAVDAPTDHELYATAEAIQRGGDPLGDRLAVVRSALDRRPLGQFLTPPDIVSPMVEWVLERSPQRIIDVGAGTGRFSAAIARQRPNIHIVAVDLDPIACILCRAHFAQLSCSATVVCDDFMRWTPEPSAGVTAYLGNPPYVRHHSLSPELKKWLASASTHFGKAVSKLAGLHLYFFLAIGMKAQAHDIGCLVTSAEWLDVKYGAFLRWLLLERLGLESLHLLSSTSTAFDDAMTTAVISCFSVGKDIPTVRVRAVADLAGFHGLQANGRAVDRAKLADEQRWTRLVLRDTPVYANSDMVPLGTVARVHRGVATGANRYFVISKAEARRLRIDAYCVSCISRAEEIIRSTGTIRASDVENMLLAIPPDLARSQMPKALREYISRGEAEGVDQAYLCRHRSPWWSVGKVRHPPIVMTYMARRPPVFALNPDGLALVNVAHGIYPSVDLSDADLTALASWLNSASATYAGNGRTYHGGLEKFEPSEVEALPVPAVLGTSGCPLMVAD